MKNIFKSVFKTLFCKHQIKELQNHPPVFCDENSTMQKQILDQPESTTAHNYGVEFDNVLISSKSYVEVKTKKKISKLEQVKQHLIDKGSIDSWTAITLYKATRLSSIIHTLRNIHGLDIESIISKDKSHFATYVYTKH
jgi:archaeosine-15-forming tRNA-guanine transglycosylase